MPAYYNEHDAFAAQWLRNLIAAGHITPGDVDERDIQDVTPDELRKYAQCHFFAGIGVWSAALRAAGVPDTANVWTGSCPCQPFSAAGKGGGFADERHLWPAFHWLIEQCRPPIVLGEQVASKDGLAWLDLVQADMEGTGYAFGAVDTCAAGFGAPHIRQRLYWVADAAGSGRRSEWPHRDVADGAQEICGGAPLSGRCSAVRGLGHAVTAGLQERVGLGAIPGGSIGPGARQAAFGAGVHAGGLADADQGQCGRLADGEGCEPDRTPAGWQQSDGGPQSGGQLCERPRPVNGLWANPDWLYCRDAKWRPVEPGTFPLAHGASSRVGRLRAYGNAINLAQATGFVEAAFAARHAALNVAS